MARQKQNRPLQREPSDLSQDTPASPGSRRKEANGVKQSKGLKEPNGHLKETVLSALPEQPGLTQLIICVGGIYASL